MKTMAKMMQLSSFSINTISYYGETLETMVAKARILDKLGRSKEATKQYQAILASGFQLPLDLKKYIEGRLAVKDLNKNKMESDSLSKFSVQEVFMKYLKYCFVSSSLLLLTLILSSCATNTQHKGTESQLGSGNSSVC